MGYGAVGEIDQLGDGVRGFQVGDRVADMTDDASLSPVDLHFDHLPE